MVLKDSTLVHVLLLRLLRHLLPNELYHPALFVELSLVRFVWNAYESSGASCKATCVAIFRLLEGTDRGKEEPEWADIQPVLSRRRQAIESASQGQPKESPA